MKRAHLQVQLKAGRDILKLLTEEQFFWMKLQNCHYQHRSVFSGYLKQVNLYRVGSSKVQKTNVRVIAASNIDVPGAIENGKFREDLFYRLNTVPIRVPALRERGEDILLLFRKFAVDFAEKYRMPAIRLDSEAKNMLLNYSWPGNVRQLKNITEQISIIEREREIVASTLRKYLPESWRSKTSCDYKKG